ncbi:DeoR/GlpR family DNA-binding transcription regulator [Isoptericola sp. NPDC057191]|uniref:DeoR/GlpR family DNA-binding transcription regulator n=1 Tax=Isoptericola sp. NPDC057191 TaxID=3346041 RepID=UPI0036407518
MGEEATRAEARRQKALALVTSRGFVRVTDLAKELQVSGVTVRHDLESLHRAGSVRRVRGGAVARQGVVPAEQSFEEALTASADEKRRIGEAAAAMVRSGTSVLIDVGTTTTAIAHALAARVDLKDVVVITNALNIALLLEQAVPRFSIVVTGGTLRPLQHSLVAPLVGEVLARVRADIAFVGCSGIDVDHGVTNVNLPEAEVKTLMMASAARTVVVADASKLGRVHLGVVAGVSQVDTIVTGAGADPGWVRRVEAAGTSVLPV